MFEILQIIPGKKKPSASGWISFNAVCCHHRCHKPDRRMRGGVKIDASNFSMHCFNCSFKCGFTLGKSISSNLKQLMVWCGVDDILIQKWSLESLQYKDLIDYTQVKKVKTRIKFKTIALPDTFDPLDPTNDLHKNYIDYLQGRGINYNEYPFLVSPSERGRQSNRIIIPYTQGNKIVGYISRYLDNRIPKYIKEQQPGYVFGIEFQKSNWTTCIVTEGIFDALSLNACAVTHDDISPEQAEVLASLNKPIIYVPHQDHTGLTAIDRALELGYRVSLPNWGPGVKDINEAVLKYGKVATLLSILQNATQSIIKIKLKRNALGKRV